MDIGKCPLCDGTGSADMLVQTIDCIVCTGVGCGYCDEGRMDRLGLARWIGNRSASVTINKLTLAAAKRQEKAARKLFATVFPPALKESH